MPIGRREKYKDLIFTAHIGQQNPGITKIIPSVDKSTYGQDRAVSVSCRVAFLSAYVQYASFKRLAGH